MINDLAIITPVHSLKIKFLDQLISSYLLTEPDVDLYIAISEEEVSYFNEYFKLYDKNKFIICKNSINAKNPITYKKLYAINEVNNLNKYKGIATVDIDSKFLRSGFNDSFLRFKSKKEIIGYPSDVPFLINIQKESSQYVSENEELKKFKTLYSVWNTLPWFICSDLYDFFNDINYHKDKFINCKWEIFDHSVYQSWLISTGKFKISKDQYRLEYPEDMPPEKRKIFNKYDTLDWIRYGARHLVCMQNKNPLMHFHVDRDIKSDQVD